MGKIISIYTDGGSRGNPGQAALGVVIKIEETTLASFGKRLGIQTNNFAEYSAILDGMRWVLANRESLGDISGINFYMDSLLACQQLKGIYRVKQPHLIDFLLSIRGEEKELGVPISYTHIPREKNKEADKMVNLALDTPF